MYLKRKKIGDTLLLLPALIILFIIEFIPMIYGLILSFMNINLNKPYLENKFIGLQNYAYLLSKGEFYHSILITFTIAFFCLLIEFVLGFLIVMMLNRQSQSGKASTAMGFFRGVLFTPNMIMSVIAGTIWFYMYDMNYGMITYLFELLGLPSINIIGTAETVIPAIIVIDVWQSTPMVMLLLSAGLKSIDPAYYEACSIDGASAWQKIRYVTLPLLKPVLAVTFCLRSMDVLRIFDTVFVTSKGGPGNVSEVMSLYVYRSAFTSAQTSRGSAGAIIIAAIVFVISILNMKYISGDVEQQS